ncbi:hypothetical protein EJ357_44640 [Streptomyces cyaneochromogenes]|uniref:Uncharacterized protein n=1 Tax=Streptomyces cyaneochromogenes TaxID=2496836 RepID=A0A3Q9EUZ3_9ACTN|nr:hypothetical protein [Streptomyces cyaneochromogenes]AZQ39652.1 hypothetical protein EJ357_44640 [Streptomyces cyaneochromogenes]
MDEQRAEIVAQGREALADIRRASDEAAAAIVRVVEQRTGVSLVAGPPSVMDATRAQLVEADRRAQHAVAAMELIRGWFWPPSVTTLGEFIRELPQDVREQIADHLVQAGLS